MENELFFLSLVRLGLGYDIPTLKEIPVQTNWGAIQALADKQGLSAIVLDGIGKLPIDSKPQKKDLLQWIGTVLREESIYAAQMKSACEMSFLFAKNHIRTYILKGFVIAECYTNPPHRRSVDLDCFLVPDEGVFDAYELGNQIMENSGFEVDRSFYKNSTIFLPGLTVENHRFMTAVRGSKRLKNLERTLQAIIIGDKCKDMIEGTSMYRPQVIVSALFLIEHAYAHFLHEGITWRHVLDWMMFSRKHYKQIDRYVLDSYIDEFGFRKFYTSYVRLGQYLLGEMEDADLTKADRKMLSDVWADLDLHETTRGFKGKVALAGNTLRAGWKYRYFSDISMIHDLMLRVTGFLFERHPKI